MAALLEAESVRPRARRRSHSFASQRENDPESALMHYRARSYDPRTGRFPAQDPILPERAASQYSDLRNTPIMARDPLGTRARDDTEGKVQKTIIQESNWYFELGNHPRSIGADPVENRGIHQESLLFQLGTLRERSQSLPTPSASATRLMELNQAAINVIWSIPWSSNPASRSR